MEFIKAARRRSFLSEVLYVALSLGLAVGTLLLVRYFQPPYLAILLVLLAKWRVLAVRPRFWLAHIESNLVDIIVSLSVVALLYLALDSLLTQIFITILFAGWLLILKPRSTRRDMALQAGVAQFVGLTTVASLGFGWNDIWIVLGCFVVASASARHFLTAYDEQANNLLSLAYGFIFAELGWLYFHWLVAYPIGESGLNIPQLAITGLLIGFLAARLYNLYVHKKAELKFRDVRQPLFFVIIILAILLFAFTEWNVVL